METAGKVTNMNVVQAIQPQEDLIIDSGELGEVLQTYFNTGNTVPLRALFLGTLQGTGTTYNEVTQITTRLLDGVSPRKGEYLPDFCTPTRQRIRIV